MILNVGYQEKNIPNGYHKRCDWLTENGFYEKLNSFEEFEINYVDVNQCDSFYYFPINGDARNFSLLSEENFFGNFTSDRVLNDLTTNKCILHINWLDEPYIYEKDEIDRLQNFLKTKKISWDRVIFSSDNFTSPMENHTPFCFFDSSIESYTHYVGFKRIDEEDLNDEIRHSKFLSMARTGHEHRKELVKLFENYDDEDILYSALWKNKRIDDRFHWPNVHNEKGLSHGEDNIDLNKYKQNPYLNSYISIVTETNFKNDIFQLTDKVFQPILNLQPFIYVAPYQGLKLLKSFGYKTFDFIDESYDDIKDENKRMKAIKDEIKRLINLEKKQLHDIYYSTMDVLKYNRNHWLLNGRRRVIKQMEVFYENIRN